MVFRVAVCSLALAAGINVRKMESNGHDLCANTDSHCCKWNTHAGGAEQKDMTPMVLFSGGCSGSSAVLTMTHDIAELSSDAVLDCGGGYELLADIESGHYGENHVVLPAAVRAFNKRAVDRNRRLLFKAESRFLRHPQTMHLLTEAHAKIASLNRWNKIDLALCAVRDCFAGFTPAPFGYLVDEANQTEDCSFRGRGENETGASKKVYVNTTNLVMNLKRLMHVKDENNIFLEKLGWEFQRIYYEDLFSFYSGSPRDLVSSSAAWQGFMQGLNVQTNFDTIYEYLKQVRSVIPPRPKHTDTMANFDAVKKMLMNCQLEECAKMVQMLRE
jgi:hypothetical protein